MSPASKAQQKAVNKYMKSNYDRVNLVMPKGKKTLFRHMRRSRGNPSMPISTVPLMKPCSGTILTIEIQSQKLHLCILAIPPHYL